jgi:type IV secretion system protein VirB2
MIVAAMVILMEPAFAQSSGSGGIESALQQVVTLLTGNVAKLLATIAVIIVGIAWMFGHLDLRKAAYVVLGIGVVFGASQLVTTIAGQ